MWWGFAALCALAGSGWLYDQAATGLLTGLPRTAIHDVLLALVFALASLRGRRGDGVAATQWLKIALAAIAIFAVPELLFESASGYVSKTTEMLVFLLVPVVVIFVIAQKSAGFGADESPLRLLAPALAAVGGAALLVPFDWPPTLAGRFWLIAILLSAVLAGVATVRLHDLLRGVNVLQAAAVAFGTCGLAAGAFCWVGWTGAPVWAASAFEAEALRTAMIEAPILLLTIWLLREMQPVAFSARLYFMPLVTIVEGYALLRQPLGWTMALGVALLTGGGWGLVRE